MGSRLLNMKFALCALAVALVASPSFAKNLGQIEVDGYGTVYIVGPDWAAGNFEMTGNGFTLRGGGRVYFASSPNDGFDPNMYWQTPLDGRHFAYNLDLSNVPCHCNAAAYFVSMPGPGGGDGGDYYCDANFVGGQWCPEYDTLESNKYTIAGTLHTCNGSPGNWNDCDRGGCQNNAFYVDPNMLCPEDRCTINTSKPFAVSHYQDSSIANIYMEQEGRSADFNFCSDGGYSSNMASQAYAGMVFTASLWGGGGIDMGWLDGMTGCPGDCDIGSASVTMSDFRVF